MQRKSILDLDIIISDNEGKLRDVSEIGKQLSEVHACFDTHAMSDRVIFLRGQKDMLGQIIDYLARI